MKDIPKSVLCYNSYNIIPDKKRKNLTWERYVRLLKVFILK